MSTLTYLSADKSRNFIDTMIENGFPITTEHHYRLGAADVWSFTLSNGDHFQLWERSRAFETVYTYYRKGIGSKQFKSFQSAVQSMRLFF